MPATFRCFGISVGGHAGGWNGDQSSNAAGNSGTEYVREVELGGRACFLKRIGFVLGTHPKRNFTRGLGDDELENARRASALELTLTRGVPRDTRLPASTHHRARAHEPVAAVVIRPARARDA